MHNLRYITFDIRGNKLHKRKEEEMKQQLLTRNGVAKDLSKSPYTFTEFNNGNTYTFYFSSKLHLNNFNKLRQQNFVMIYNYIYKRFKFKVDCQTLADFNLYKKIEHRGCYIKINNKCYSKIEHISLN